MENNNLMTDEQKDINNSSAKIKLIEAYAGTGKTWVLQKEAEKYKNEKILYLVYGRNAKLDAERLFSSYRNVDVKTIHSHAFRQERGKWNPSEYSLSISKALSRLEDKTVSDKVRHEIAWAIYHLLNRYLNMPEKELEIVYNEFCGLQKTDEKERILRENKTIIIETTSDMLEDWLSGDEECPHDFYMKYSYLSNSFQKGLNRYDRILVDEAQDLSPIMLSCLDNYKKSVVMVGDSHQSIYSFRHSLNALTHLKADEVFTLSKSFRFGKTIADFITDFMSTVVDSSFKMRGNEEIDSTILVSDSVYLSNDSAILARTNLGLITKSVECLQNNIPFYFEKDVGYLFDKLDDLWNLSCGNTRKIRDEFIRSFKSIDAVQKYAKTVEDLLLLSLVSIIDTYYNDLPELIKELRENVSNNSDFNQLEKETIIALSTIHASKGKEYECVGLSDDIYRNIEKAVSSGNCQSEECRIFYVGGTRAKEQLILSSQFDEAYKYGWEFWKQMKKPMSDEPFWD